MATTAHPGRTPHPDTVLGRIKEHPIVTGTVAAGLGLLAIVTLAKGPLESHSAESRSGGQDRSGQLDDGSSSQSGNGQASPETQATQESRMQLPTQPEHPEDYYPTYALGENIPNSDDPQTWLNQLFYNVEAAINTNNEQFLTQAGIQPDGQFGQRIMDLAAFHATQRDTAHVQGFYTLIPELLDAPAPSGSERTITYNLAHIYQDAGNLPWQVVRGEEGEEGYTGVYTANLTSDGQLVETDWTGPVETSIDLS